MTAPEPLTVEEVLVRLDRNHGQFAGQADPSSLFGDAAEVIRALLAEHAAMVARVGALAEEWMGSCRRDGLDCANELRAALGTAEGTQDSMSKGEA